jgi:hypothetical protein
MELTLAEAASCLGVTTRQAQRLAESGRLQAVRRAGRSPLVKAAPCAKRRRPPGEHRTPPASSNAHLIRRPSQGHLVNTANDNSASSFPADQPARPPDHWLSAELARASPPLAPSRLRQLADTQGTVAAAWSSAIAAGPVLALAGGVISAMSGSPVWALVLGLMGAALLVLGLFSWKRVRATLPKTNGLLVTRGPGSTRGGIVMVSVLAAVLGGFLATTWPAGAARGTATLVALICAYLLTVALLVACILVPSTVMGRARSSFRRRVPENPDPRRAVEDDLATWRDAPGNAGHGPLWPPPFPARTVPGFRIGDSSLPSYQKG